MPICRRQVKAHVCSWVFSDYFSKAVRGGRQSSGTLAWVEAVEQNEGRFDSHGKQPARGALAREEQEAA